MINKLIIVVKLGLVATVSIAMGTMLASSLVSADSIKASANLSIGAGSGSSPSNHKTLQDIVTAGDKEIARRLTTLSSLDTKITDAKKLTSSDQAYLTSEVSSTTTGLQGLKTQLDSATSITQAQTDVSDIYTEYRVYALVAPKVNIIKVADDQQVNEGLLSDLHSKLESRVNSSSSSTAKEQAELSDMNTNITNAQNISSSVESSVLVLTPTDYNNDHAILVGYNAKLKVSHADNEAALKDANEVMAQLK